ncbi:transmembrane protein 222 [Phyllostomus discolor]|uniref:Transmembrane protein 222 n=1 Tax=Phyllostomus discolor TaxID=89673 RepID=A0A834AM28_9CHIR|nr:transmembrane protein 222 [Phyllostomus discolor]
MDQRTWRERDPGRGREFLGATPWGWHPEPLVLAHRTLAPLPCCLLPPHELLPALRTPSQPQSRPGPHFCPPARHAQSLHFATCPGLSYWLDACSPLTSALVPQQEDNMAFGKPAKYWKLDPARVYASGPNAWDTAVHDASEEYKHRMHNLCCDNCHSHVALALNLMRYNNSTNWNMVTLCFFCLLYGKYVSVGAFVKTWLPFVLLLGIILTTSLVFNLR